MNICLLHDWSKWIDEEKIHKMYDPDNGPDALPVEQYIIQIKECQKCGKKKVRREKI